MSNAIVKRQEKDKGLLLEKLRNTPIIQVACQQVGMGRATYYRWRKRDKEFARKADEALFDGRAFVNDMAESQLISAIKDNNLGAIIFWLRSHHSSYSPKIEVDANIKIEKEILTPEQELLVKKALKLAGLLTAPKGEKNEN